MIKSSLKSAFGGSYGPFFRSCMPGGVSMRGGSSSGSSSYLSMTERSGDGVRERRTSAATFLAMTISR
ncbi:hypothetical protein OCU04_000352 [Sclerotinia nivalis]|uniref:Uncharacterized protein n=1 Tax=Sclerotinia nivalis TaxID=352851 RepID=A0A9X0DNC0_9HELO|nr:hypothetical protein OCU04_000352 [Sclerotinia nivalis]